ncbi:ATP-dependent DNA helicase, RecQ family protein, partial [Vibrio parahaemolyticus V-223/04]
SRHS